VNQMGDHLKLDMDYDKIVRSPEFHEELLNCFREAKEIIDELEQLRMVSIALLLEPMTI